jgi:hypothetical protein
MKRITIAAVAALAATAATAAPAAAEADVTRCVSTTQYISDGGSKYCVSTDSSCLVAEWRTTFLGTEYYCHVRNPA